MTTLEIDRILTLDWPLIVRRVMAGDGDEWTKGFVLSIARQGKRPTWRPTAKQAGIMRRLIAEHRQASDDIEVIED